MMEEADWLLRDLRDLHPGTAERAFAIVRGHMISFLPWNFDRIFGACLSGLDDAGDESAIDSS